MASLLRGESEEQQELAVRGGTKSPARIAGEVYVLGYACWILAQLLHSKQEEQ